MEVPFSERLKKLPPYLFADLRRKINAARARGVNVITLGIGDPDTPTPDPVVEELCRALRDESDPNRHRYGCDCPAPEFVQAVRAQNASIPILMVTTNAAKEDIVQALQAGVNNYVVKPFTPDTLKEKIESLLG